MRPADGGPGPEVEPWRAMAAVLLVAAALATTTIVAPRLTGDGDTTPEGFESAAALFRHLQEAPVDPPDADELTDAAVDAMLERIDDSHAERYSPEEFREVADAFGDELIGIGVEIADTPDGLEVIDVFADTPAANAGVEPGDHIVAVDGHDVSDATMAVAVDRIQGDVGSEVDLTLLRGDAEVDATVTRERIRVPAVTADLRDSGVLHLHVRSFSARTGDDARELLADQDDAHGAILDVRGNPGGTLVAATDLAAVFLDGDTVTVIDQAAGTDEVTASKGALDHDLVVLVDGRSASASELVAAALADHGRATVVGETTQGKGSVQHLHQLPDGSGVRYTISRFRSPSGADIDGVGVNPDMEVSGPAAQLRAAEDLLTGEALHR